VAARRGGGCHACTHAMLQLVLLASSAAKGGW
jgi:hypothetical protein